MPIQRLAEQRRIVAKVEQLTALVDALETQLAAACAAAGHFVAIKVVKHDDDDVFKIFSA